MDLKEKIVSSYVAFEDGVNINSDIHNIRTEAFQNFEKLGFPSKKIRSLEIYFIKQYSKGRL